MLQYFRNGYSLLELLMVLFLIALCFSFGMPLTQQWYRHHLGLRIQEDIKQAIREGMSQAIIQGEDMRLIPLKDNQWSGGLKLVTENDQPNTLGQWTWNKKISVQWHGFLSQHYLKFSSEFNQSAMNGYFLIENSSQEQIKVIINRLGRIRLESRAG